MARVDKKENTMTNLPQGELDYRRMLAQREAQELVLKQAEDVLKKEGARKNKIA